MSDDDAHRSMLADGWTYIEYGGMRQTVAGYTCREMPCARHGIDKPARKGMVTHSGWATHADPVEARRLARAAAMEGCE